LVSPFPAGVYLLAIAPADDELRERYKARIESERARAEEATRLAREAELGRQRAVRELEERKREQQRRDAVEPPATKTSTPPKGNARSPRSDPPTRVKPCNPEDPMAFCL
jgi:hypothetical protein